jgi:hypothetical protein
MAEGINEADSVIAGSPSTAKFTQDPQLPNCSAALVRGDPAKGPFTWLDKSDGDCFVPMHWHNQGEIIIVVSGNGRDRGKESPLRHFARRRILLSAASSDRLGPVRQGHNWFNVIRWSL